MKSVLKNSRKTVAGVCLMLTSAILAPASVLYTFSVPAQPSIPFGPLTFEYLSPQLITFDNNPGTIPGSDLIFQSADFPISSVFIFPGVFNPPTQLLGDVQYDIDSHNPNFTGQIFGFGFLDQFGTFMSEGGCTEGVTEICNPPPPTATLTIELIPEPRFFGLLGVLLVLGGAAFYSKTVSSHPGI